MSNNSPKITISPELLTQLNLPAAVVARLMEGYRLATRSGERRIFRKLKPMPVSEWAEKYRVLTMSVFPGKWHNEITPYSAGVMDASFFKSVETIIICKTPQTGISEAVNNCIAFAADRSPAPALYVFPDELTAKENSRDRLQPMFTASPKLRRLKTDLEDDMAGLRINLRSMPIYMAWAGSAARLANKPIGRLVLDEIDKYPEHSNKREASPVDLAEKRTTTFRGHRKIWKISTPTIESGPIWQSLTKEAQVIFDYWVTCPDCGTLQLMAFKHIKWPANERDPEKISGEELAHYGCPHCQSEWDDHRRDLAVQAGVWYARTTQTPGAVAIATIATGAETALDTKTESPSPTPGLELFDYLENYLPKKIGFHLPSFVSRFVSLSEIAAAFLKAKDSKDKLRDFKNGYEARPWKIINIARKEDRILLLKDNRPRGVVPGNNQIIALTAGVDTQDYGYYYAIRAWSGGPKQTSWLIDEGLADTGEALLEILFETTYFDLDQNPYIVNLAIHDAMGHRTSEVYDLTRLNRRRHLPYQGAPGVLTSPWKISQIEFYPASKGKNIPIPGGLKLVRGYVGYYKDILDTKLQINPGTPGALNLHSETPAEYAAHMCVEYIDEKTQRWVNPEKKANHYWDCEYMNFLAADILRLKTRTQPMGSGVSDKTVPQKPKSETQKPKKKRRLW